MTMESIDDTSITTETPSFYNLSLKRNISIDYQDEDYIFDRLGVRALFITLYSLVFCCCFFGKYLIVFSKLISQVAISE